MGVYINMEMPKRCGECPCFHAENPMYCQAVKADKNKKIIAPYGKPRPEWCPLVPVPPHGRVIDADALEDRCIRQARNKWNRSTGTNWGYAYATFESDVEDAPTIIEAEEKYADEEEKIKIAKMLAAIYYTAVHWDEEEWEDFVKCIVGNCADIAFAVGGERMMTIEVPALVMELNQRLHKAEEDE